jgi:proline dehydrogenase
MSRSDRRSDAATLSRDWLQIYDTAPPKPSARLSYSRLLRSKISRAASDIVLPAVKRVAGDLLGGDTLDDAWAIVGRLQAAGLSHTLGFWDTPAYSADEVVDIYLASIERAGPCGPDGYVSIKPPALRFDAAAARRLGRVAARANVRLHCDSHGVPVADLTFAFVEDLLAELPPHLVSVTLPGRWSRSLDDADRLLARGIGVRVVKGEWPDPDEPSRDLTTGFLKLIDRAAGHRGGIVAVATHNAPLAIEAVGRLLAAGRSCEVEAIWGLQSQPWLAFARRLDLPARIYVPFGKGFAPNALRVLRGNPALALKMLGGLAYRPA